MVFAAARADRLGLLLLALGLAGWLLVAAAVATRSPAPLPTGLALLGVEYAASLLLSSGGVDPFAPVVGAALFAAAELAYWSLEAGVVPDERARVVRHLTTVAISALVAGSVGGVVVTAADFAVNGGVALEALGVAAAVASVGFVAALAWRRREPQPEATGRHA